MPYDSDRRVQFAIRSCMSYPRPPHPAPQPTSASDKFHYSIHAYDISFEDACAEIVSHAKQKVLSGQLWSMFESLMDCFETCDLNIVELTIMNEADKQQLTKLQKVPLENIFKGKRNAEEALEK